MALIERANRDNWQHVATLIGEFVEKYPWKFETDKDVIVNNLYEMIDEPHVFIGLMNKDEGIFIGSIKESIITVGMVGEEILLYVRKSSQGTLFDLVKAFVSFCKLKKARAIHMALPKKTRALERLGFNAYEYSYIRILDESFCVHDRNDPNEQTQRLIS